MHQPNDVVEFAMVHLSTNLRLHYAERGDRREKAIVFLHAYVGSWYWFSRVLPLLSPEYHAFAPTNAGTGTPTSPNAATRRTITPPTSTRSWRRLVSRRRPS